MAGNFLEDLVSQWYQYRGYFVRQNIQVGKRLQGGYECELDIVAFDPVRKHLIQIEPSMDSDSWEVRETRYLKKFSAGKKHVPDLFRGLELPTNLEQIALFVFAGKDGRQSIGGGRVMHVRSLFEQIFQAICQKRVQSGAIPQQYPLLRSLQFVAEYRDSIWQAMEGRRVELEAPARE